MDILLIITQNKKNVIIIMRILRKSIFYRMQVTNVFQIT